MSLHHDQLVTHTVTPSLLRGETRENRHLVSRLADLSTLSQKKN
jgi:hypothetical protein